MSDDVVQPKTPDEVRREPKTSIALLKLIFRVADIGFSFDATQEQLTLAK